MSSGHERNSSTSRLQQGVSSDEYGGAESTYQPPVVTPPPAVSPTSPTSPVEEEPTSASPLRSPSPQSGRRGASPTRSHGAGGQKRNHLNVHAMSDDAQDDSPMNVNRAPYDASGSGRTNINHRSGFKAQSYTLSQRAVIGCAVLTLVALIIYAVIQSRNPLNDDNNGLCPIFCSGDILNTMQLSGLFNDSKTFVDMPLLKDPQVVLEDWESLPNTNLNTLSAFLARNFAPAGSDVISWNPPDFNASPLFLTGIADSNLRSWASKINGLWYSLGRQVVDDVYNNPTRHTLLPVKSHTMIVPGGRFREFYYWDSYWIIKGLLVCGMNDTALMIAENMLDMVKQYGYVPNGSRAYYLSRSQPPFLSLMVEALWQAGVISVSFLRDAVPLLDKEYSYWMTLGGHAVQLNARGASYTLNRYNAKVDGPRPEGYREDIAIAATFPPTADVANVYSQLTAGAETGWDYSSRWFADGYDLNTTTTTNIIPADLNAIMYKVEFLLQKYHAALGDVIQSQFYSKAMTNRKAAIQSFLFDATHSQWRDYNIQTHAFTQSRAISNWVPLWTRCFDNGQVNEDSIIESLMGSGLLMPGGIVTSLVPDLQQWDYPDAWPPLQHMIIEGLQNSISAKGAPLAMNLTSTWINSNYAAFQQYQVMFEKYYAPIPGSPGGGGEYVIQAGFGWTNGVALTLLQQYGGLLTVT